MKEVNKDEEDDPTMKYLNFNKNSSLKARLFNKNSQLIIKSINNSTEANNKYMDLLEIENIYDNNIEPIASDRNNSINLNNSNQNNILEEKKEMSNESNIKLNDVSIKYNNIVDKNANDKDSATKNINNDTTTFSERIEGECLKNIGKV